jgi:fluoride exporter
MMQSLILVGVGGAAGSMLRYLFQRCWNVSFPYGTLCVNLAGCFLIGLLWGLALRNSLDDNMKLLLMTGFCGGFTTFSAFTQESMQMLQEQRLLHFFVYLLLSITAGLLATFAGYKLTTL